MLSSADVVKGQIVIISRDIGKDNDEVEKLIVKLSKSGKKQSEIGMILRDSYGIPDVRVVLDKKLGKVIEENDLTQEVQEEIINLIKNLI